MSDSPNNQPESPDESVVGAKPEFTKAAQPDLPLAQRKQKAGWNWNRFLIWIAVGGFAIYLIVTGIVGILTKAR